MISAMPAVALRRERRRSQARSFSREGSIAFSDRKFSTADFSRKFSEDSLRRSSVLSAQAQIERNQYELKRRKSYLMQTAAVCITTGVIVLLLGLSLDTTPLYSVSLLMIALGIIICLMRLFIGMDGSSQSQIHQYNACRVRGSGEKKVSVANSATSYDVESDMNQLKYPSKQTSDPQELETLRVAALPATRRDSNRFVPETKDNRPIHRPSNAGPHLSVSHSECGPEYLQTDCPLDQQPRRVSSGDSGVDMIHITERNMASRPVTRRPDNSRTVSSPSIVTLSRNLSLSSSAAVASDAVFPDPILLPATNVTQSVI
jgi:hypothetical protein